MDCICVAVMTVAKRAQNENRVPIRCRLYGHTDKQTNRQTHTHTHTHRLTHTHTHTHTDRLIDKQTHRQKDTQADKKSEKAIKKRKTTTKTKLPKNCKIEKNPSFYDFFQRREPLYW